MSAESMTLTMERRPPPARRRKLVADGVMGMLLFVFTEAMLFAGMISAHVIVRSQAAGMMWPPYGQPRLPVVETAFNSAALLASGLVLLGAHFAFRSESLKAAPLVLGSLLLGSVFVVFQGVEWVALIQEGLTLQSSTYGSFFYLIVGTHAAHAVAALGALAWAWSRLRQGTLTASQLGTVEVLWYFVVLIWPVLYWRVYL